MSELQIFSSEAGLIRTDYSDEGEPLVCAADLARIVGLSSPERAYARIDADYKLMRITHTPSGSQEMVFLTEPGVYQFLLGLRIKAGSKHHERIKQFQKHVFEVVLPTIRRTGGYGVQQAHDEPVNLAPYVAEFEAGIRVALARK